MDQVRVPAQIIPGSVTAADGHLRDAHLLLDGASAMNATPFMAAAEPNCWQRLMRHRLARVAGETLSRALS